jgi:hypothetical protein
MGIFQQSDPLEVAHSVDEGLALYIGVDHYFSLEGQLIETVLVGEGEDGGFLELSLESDIEVDQFILQHIRQRLGIGDDTFNHCLIIL